MRLNIEIKTCSAWYDKELTRRTVSLVQQSGIKDRVIFSSFEHRSLLDAKELDDTIPCGLLYVGNLIHPGRYAKAVGAEYIHPCWDNLDRQGVEDCRENGIEIHPWDHQRSHLPGCHAGVRVRTPDHQLSRYSVSLNLKNRAAQRKRAVLFFLSQKKEENISFIEIWWQTALL